MKSFLPALLFSVCALSHALATVEEDEALVAKDIEALHDEHEEVRAMAAAELRAIIARYPSGTSDLRNKDSGEAMWREKLKDIRPGMTWVNVMKCLPCPLTRPNFQELTTDLVVGVGRTEVYQWGHNWKVALTWNLMEDARIWSRIVTKPQIIPIQISNGFSEPWVIRFSGCITEHMELLFFRPATDRPFQSLPLKNNWNYTLETHGILDSPPALIRDEWHIEAPVPESYSGIWTEWYANGQIWRETLYENGKTIRIVRKLGPDGEDDPHLYIPL